MDNLRDKLALYLVTDRDMLTCEMDMAIERAILGGVTIVQLREKGISDIEFIARAIIVKRVCDKYNVPLIINDNVNVCIAANADGVHLGQSDGNIKDARAKLGADKIIGVSARTIDMAIDAQSAGADYLGVGAVFGTTTKSDALTLSPEILQSIVSSVDIPVVAIGGVSLDNISKLDNTGIAGAAVISAILKSDDITLAASNIKAKLVSVIKIR